MNPGNSLLKNIYIDIDIKIYMYNTHVDNTYIADGHIYIWLTLPSSVLHRSTSISTTPVRELIDHYNMIYILIISSVHDMHDAFTMKIPLNIIITIAIIFSQLKKLSDHKYFRKSTKSYCILQEILFSV